MRCVGQVSSVLMILNGCRMTLPALQYLWPPPKSRRRAIQCKLDPILQMPTEPVGEDSRRTLQRPRQPP